MGKYVSQVEYDPISDDYVITLPDEMLSELGWVPGDVLRWDEQSDGSIILSKIDKDTVNTSDVPLNSV